MAIDFDTCPTPYRLLLRPLDRAAERVALELSLSEAEQSTLAGLLMGLNNEEIAQALDVARADVKWNAHQIFEKSGRPNREALTRHVLLHELKHYRDRVQVCDLDIVAAGLGDPELCVECPRLVAWCAANGLHIVGSHNEDYDPHGGHLRHGFYDSDPRANRDASLIMGSSPMAHDHIINALAEAVGRAPLDVLDEIAGSSA